MEMVLNYAHDKRTLDHTTHMVLKDNEYSLRIKIPHYNADILPGPYLMDSLAYLFNLNKIESDSKLSCPYYSNRVSKNHDVIHNSTFDPSFFISIRKRLVLTTMFRIYDHGKPYYISLHELNGVHVDFIFKKIGCEKILRQSIARSIN